MKTPTTRDGLTQYDHLPWEEAAHLAWHATGTRPDWHHKAQHLITREHPQLAHQLEANNMGQALSAWREIDPKAQEWIRGFMPLLARAPQRATNEK